MRQLRVCSLIIAATVTGAWQFGESAAASQLSPLELQRADAAATFGPQLVALASMRTQIADDQKKYDVACRGKVTTARPTVTAGIPLDRTFFPPFEIKNEATPTCRMLVTDIKTRTEHMKRELERIGEDARRRGIYPGVMRDLKRNYGFE